MKDFQCLIVETRSEADQLERALRPRFTTLDVTGFMTKYQSDIILHLEYVKPEHKHEHELLVSAHENYEVLQIDCSMAELKIKIDTFRAERFARWTEEVKAYVQEHLLNWVLTPDPQALMFLLGYETAYGLIPEDGKRPRKAFKQPDRMYESTELWNREAKEFGVWQQLMILFPNLYFYVHGDEIGMWIRRDGKDGESVGHTTIDPGGLHFAEIGKLNLKAGFARQDDWFWCSRCRDAKPRTEYGYFYFAGNYCKTCQVENPEHYKKAQAESYN